jgi:hypothetical protein
MKLLGLLIPLVCLFLIVPIKAEALTVDLAADLGEMSTKGTGFHGGLHDSTPDAMIDPIKPRFIRRPGGTKAWERARRLDITLIELLAGYDYQGNWSGWSEHVTKRVAEMKKQNIKYHYDVWNEPDLGQFWGLSRQQFFEWYRDTYRLLKQLDPEALVSAPSNAYYSSGYMTDFLTFAKANNVVPDILSWHEMGTSTPQALENNFNNAKTIFMNLGLPMSLVHNNEALNYGLAIRPSTSLVHIAHSHRHNTLGSARAYWSDSESNARLQLNHMLTTSLTPRSVWWMYQRYATMTGKTLKVQFDAGADAVASKDPFTGKVYILAGKYADQATTTITLNNVSAAGFLGSQVLVKGQRIPYSGTNAAPEPVETFSTTLPVVNNSLSFSLSATEIGLHDAYFFTLTGAGPTGSPSPTTAPIKTGDLNQDGKVDYLDYLKLLSGFGSSYNLFQFNGVVGNFGK